MTDQNPDRLKIKHEQRLAWDDSAEGWKRWWPTFERAAQRVNYRLIELSGARATFATHPDQVRRQLREAMVSSARAHAGPDGVVRLRNETICFAARS